MLTSTADTSPKYRERGLTPMMIPLLCSAIMALGLINMTHHDQAVLWFSIAAVLVVASVSGLAVVFSRLTLEGTGEVCKSLRDRYLLAGPRRQKAILFLGSRFECTRNIRYCWKELCHEALRILVFGVLVVTAVFALLVVLLALGNGLALVLVGLFGVTFDSLWEILLLAGTTFFFTVGMWWLAIGYPAMVMLEIIDDGHNS